MLDLKFNPKSILEKKLPDLPDLDSVKKPIGDTVNKVKDTVKGALDKVTDKEIPLPRGVDFGSKGRELFQDSSLGTFLGRLGIGPPPEPRAENTSGSRIPGGPELYEKGGMYHKGAPGAPDTYAFENTPEGIKFAAENGYESIDLDMLITKDGVPVATHYTDPLRTDGFYDPLGKLGEDTRVSDMTFAEISRLRNEDGQSQIYPMSTMIEELKKNGIAGDLEAKEDPRFADDEVMGGIADMVRDAGIRANLKTIDRSVGSYKILEAAQRQGFWVRTATGNNRDGRHFGYGEDPSGS